MSAVAAHLRPYQPRSQQNTPAAFLLAVMMHALLVAALWLSVQWHTEPAGPVVVELWGAPPEPAVVAPPPPAPPVKVEPEPERPDAEIVVKQEPKKPQPDLKKLEEEKRQREAEARRQEAEKKQREAEAKRLEAEKKQLELQRKKQAEAMAQAEQRRIEEQRREAVRRAEQQRMLAQAQAGGAAGSAAAEAGGGGRGDPTYAAQLVSLIRPRIVFAVPDGTSPDIHAEFQVDLLPTGEILAVRRLKSSGLPGYDDAVERAIRRTDPFPRKRDGTVERSVTITFRPVQRQ